MYHNVSDEAEAGVGPYYRVATSPARFRQHMTWVRECGFSAVGLDEALNALEVGNPRRAAMAVVTFDDGYRDFLTDAWPVLSEFGFKATVFLATAFVSDSRRSFKGRECLTWSEVRDLNARGVSFGSHTVTHPKLHGSPWADVRRELRESRARIEDEIHTVVNSFAYPYAFPQEDADFVSRLKGELLECGYAAAVTTIVGRVAPGDDRLCLKRLPANECDDEVLFKAKLTGAYDWVRRFQALARHAKRRRPARQTEEGAR
jgi:peptidoglycan/xylan/chitin deacetylase (PgdA/CDA1 family)